jgi:hypothetical protein
LSLFVCVGLWLIFLWNEALRARLYKLDGVLGTSDLAETATHALLGVNPAQASRPFHPRNRIEITPVVTGSTTRAKVALDLGSETARIQNTDSPFDQDRHGLAAAGAAVADKMVDIMPIHCHMNQPGFLCFPQNLDGLLRVYSPSRSSASSVSREEMPLKRTERTVTSSVCSTLEFRISKFRFTVV